MSSAKFDKVYRYYSMGLWTVDQVKKAVSAKWITEAEFKKIVGQS